MMSLASDVAATAGAAELEIVNTFYQLVPVDAALRVCLVPGRSRSCPPCFHMELTGTCNVITSMLPGSNDNDTYADSASTHICDDVIVFQELLPPGGYCGSISDAAVTISPVDPQVRSKKQRRSDKRAAILAIETADDDVMNVAIRENKTAADKKMNVAKFNEQLDGILGRMTRAKECAEFLSVSQKFLAGGTSEQGADFDAISRRQEVILASCNSGSQL